MKIRVFTDGACSKNGKQGAKASYACWFPENPELSVAKRVPEEESQTNQRAELLAIHEAVKILQTNFPCEELEVEIFTDSMYSRSCLTEWIIDWVPNNWKKKDGQLVKHRDIIEDCSNQLSKFKSYIISYVPAHTGGTDEKSKNNDIVDKMAVAVLEPNTVPKQVTSNTAKPIEGLPIEIMGPSVNQTILAKWCRNNMDKLDDNEVNNALITALTKTLKQHGYTLEKQRLHRTNVFRLIANNLIAEDVKEVKEE